MRHIYRQFGQRARSLAALVFLLLGATAVSAQSPHDSNIHGVQIGMDVPTALGAIGRNPDAKKNEGENGLDIRVLYRETPEGPLQIVFANGKWVKEIVIQYTKPPQADDLRLLETSSTYGNTGGETRRDDRYSVGYTSDDKKERYWWRDEKTPDLYRIRIGFVSAKLSKGGLAGKEIARKIITVLPEDSDKFVKAMASRKTAL